MGIKRRSRLLSYAEGGEDDIEDAFDIDLADDVADGLERFADFEGDELGGFAALESDPGGEEALGGTFEGGFVTSVDGDGVVCGERSGGGDDVADGVTQLFNTGTGEARNRDALDTASTA
jgi:hypothetical protein